MMESTRQDKQRKLEELRIRQKRDQVRLIALVVLLALVLVIYFMAGQRPEAPPDVAPTPDIASQIALPPVGELDLSTVADATPEQRVLLEAEPFRELARLARALLGAHLEALDEPAIPFERLPAEAAALRGGAFRLRGELRHAEPRVRAAGLPEETWCWIRDAGGRDCFYVSVNPPEEALAPGGWVLADGYFFKVYSQSIGGQRIEAPLLVGRQIVPSVPLAAPAEEIDLALLAEVRDDRFGDDRPLDPTGLWHLVGHAALAGADQARLRAEFAGAPELDMDLLRELAARPELFRGKPFRVPGRVPQDPRWTGSMPAGENPLRVRRLHAAWLGNTLVFGHNPIHLVAGDDYAFDAVEAQVYLGWFLQLKGYIDREDAPRRAPVFVIAGAEPAPPPPPSFLDRFMLVFIGCGAVLAALVYGLARRDRAQAQVAAQALRERRHRNAKRDRPAS